MLYYSSLFLKHYINCFNVIHYISFRSIAGLLTALILSIAGGNWFICWSRQYFKMRAREHTPETHKAKGDMPTMGGIFIIGIVTLTTLLWCNSSHKELLIFLGTLIGFGLIGFWDDWSKIVKKRGISERHKLCAQIVIATLSISSWLWLSNPSTTLSLPFFKNISPDLGCFFTPWAILVLVATSNAVNLTDGLDGLAIGSLIMNFATFSIIAYVAGHATFSAYLGIPFAGTAEIAILGAILVGASLGFLWYNTYPAQIFMGDVGSLSLGAGLGLMALMTKQELLLIISGGLFVAETISVIIQVITYKLWRTRFFKMAPMHHHFELMGWQESKITVRFGIISFVLCLLTLITLKLR
ncbi:MAG: phospho-N-acetylmuramoyl-pentapeptide-transferase [Candidatus Babeliaceae bacterium]|jgi:phospho-N-acetylmuramoyl-pentapeptide-transferase